MNTAAMIEFETELFTINDWTILKLPAAASAKLPSRGMALVEGTINGARFRYPLEPDGRGSHWIRTDKLVQAEAGDSVEVAIEPSKDWPEPDIPTDMQQALTSDKAAAAIWQEITPMARWDWIRWACATNNPDTRQRHMEVMCSKLKAGTRRPCCFNRALCAEPSVSKNCMLLEPVSATR